MKLLYTTLFMLMGAMSFANAADITIFYSPSCPHCHHARDFIKKELIFEYNDLKVTEINATVADNRKLFLDTLTKCKYTSGGVPVIVIGEDCFQGYGISLNEPMRAAIESDYTDAQKQSAAANRKELTDNHDAFVSQHMDRLNAITTDDTTKKN